MLVFPAEPPDSRLSGGFDDRNVKHLAADLAVGARALLPGNVNQRLVGNGFHKAITQKIHREAESTDSLSIGNALLNLRVRESRIRADGAIIHKRSAGDDFCSASDRDVWILETPIRSPMSHAQFRDLACPSRGRVLVTLAAGLRVVERPKPVFHIFRFIKFLLIGLVGCVINHAVAFVVEASGRFRKLQRHWSQKKTENSTGNQNSHRLFSPPRSAIHRNPLVFIMPYRRLVRRSQ